jgi:HK97 family phage prohead protease
MPAKDAATVNVTTEYRLLSKDLSMETRADDGANVINGYAAKFDSPTEIWPGFTEVVKRGAFADSIKRKDDVAALVDHNTSMLLGRSTSGTLRLWEDVTGLRVQIAPPDTQLGIDTVKLIKRGDLQGMSFGFIVRKDSMDYKADGSVLRELQAVDLFDVSVVTFPAYDSTEVWARSEKRCRDIVEAWKRSIGGLTSRARLRLAEKRA